MCRALFSLSALLLFAPLFLGCDNRKVQGHSLCVDSGSFLYDTAQFVIGSAEISYARVPKEYWEHRICLLKQMGVNTIMVRVPWTLHEPQEGVYNFEGQNDIREFCRMAGQHGLLVWLHVGPYSDNHIDMGGLPWWLLGYDDMQLRSRNRLFMDRVGRYFRMLGSQLSDLRISAGGPIAMIHIEESATLDGNIKGYISDLCDSVRAAGFSDTQLTIAATKERVRLLPQDKAAIALEIDDDEDAMHNFSGARKVDPNAPILCYGISRSATMSWGEMPQRRNLDKVYLRMFEVFEGLGSVNISDAIGGTSFGHLAGSEIKDGKMIAYSTSYDNGALINECGRTWEVYHRYKETFKRSATQIDGADYDGKVAAVPLVSLPLAVVKEYAPFSLDDNACRESDSPLTFELCGFGYGAMMYTATLPDVDSGTILRFNGHDNAQVFVDGKKIANCSRLDDAEPVLLPDVKAGANLEILVDAFGRVSNIPGYKDFKGLVGDVSLVAADGTEVKLSGWKCYPMPSEYDVVSCRSFDTLQGEPAPGYYKTNLKVEKKGDTYLYMGTWGRGEVWINGHSLGRFCNRGPQQTLYLPGCWLNEGDNELLILDWEGPHSPVVEGFITHVN